MDEFQPADKTSDFWKTQFDPESESFKLSLDVDAVVRNTIANMRRLEEEATLKVVIQYLESIGYTVIEPVKEES